MATKEKKTGPLKLSLSDLLEYQDDHELISSTIDPKEQAESNKQSELIKILDVWQKEKKADQTIKIVICIAVLILVILQAGAINMLIFKIANETSNLDEVTLRLIVGGVFLEIVAIFKIIVSSLFPQNGSKDFLEFISNYKKNCD